MFNPQESVTNRGIQKLNADATVEKELGFLHAFMSANVVVSGYYLNLKTQRYTAIGQETVYSQRYNTEDDWSRMDDYIRECIHPDDQALITEVSRIDYIRERLKKEQNYAVNVRDHGTGKERWYHFAVMRCADEDHAAIYFRDVTAETMGRQELERKNAEIEATKEELNKALGIADALSYSFDNVYVVDRKARILEVIKLNGYITKGIDKSKSTIYPYDPVVETYIRDRVYGPDKDLVTDFLNWDKMLDRIKKHGVYSFTYRISDNGEIHDFQGRFRTIDEQYIACGFQNIDETIAKEKEYNDIMAAAGFGIWHIYLKDGVKPRMQANQKMAELLGINTTGMTEEDIYDAWYDRITPDAIPSVQKSVGEMMEGQFSENTYLWTHPTKGDIYVRCGGTCVKLHDGTNMLRGYHADVTDIVKEKEEKSLELQNKNEEITALNEEQQAQLEEITALNNQLEENQAQLEEAAAEQEAQIEEITALNDSLQEKDAKLEKYSEEILEAKEKAEKESARVSEAYGMIFGLSTEYHTIWVVDKETSKMRLVRSSGVSTIQNAVQMGIDLPAFDSGFDKYINTYVMPEDRERMHREIAFAEILRQLEKGDRYSVNYLRKDDSGHVGYHQIAFANADTADGKKQFVYGFRDIDEMMKEELKQKEEFRRAKEDAESANAAKTSFLFNMSHDIRTPMNAIMGFRDLLEKHQDDPKRRQDYLKKIQDSSHILLSIINNVLEMARIEKGTLEIDESAWSAEQFNDTLFSVFHDMMKQKGLKFTREINVQNNYVFCDPLKLREIFINILSNAYKYTNAGGNVHMQVDEIPCNREGWVFYRTTISDTGIGMAEDFIPHIFDEFARENSSTETKIEGTGLGMPIVKRLVEMLGGTIEVKSKKDVGSTFIVTIPHKLADKSNLVDHAGVEIDPKVFEGKRILLAEDNELNAEIAMEILGEAGFLIEHAQDGNACVNMLKDSPADYYDAILMDIQMPHMNGYEATRAIRIMQDTAKSGIPIIAMTANAFEEDKREALRSGMNGHIAKPINVPELMRQLAFMLA